ncbi:MAG: type IV pilus biogenesis/stability protein PilW [Burkholderiales bacterium]
MRQMRAAGHRVALMMLMAALGGCVSQSQTTDRGVESKDIVTASDESDGSKRSRVRMELATGYYGRGQMTTALDQVKLAIIADPTFAEAFNMRGLIYSNLGDDKLAEESFRRALQLAPQDPDSMQNFGYFLCQKKRYAEATAMFDQALAVPRYRDSGRTLLTKGVCQAFAGDLAGSEASLVRAYSLEPGNPSISVNLSEVLYRRGDFERARFYIRRVNATPTLQGAQTLWLAARIEQRLGNRTGAQELGEQLRQRFPDSREAGLYARGQFDE